MIGDWIDMFKDEFHLNFIQYDRWLLLVDGLIVTLKLTILSGILGIAIGMVIATIRCTHDEMYEGMVGGWKKYLLKFGNWFCKFYLTVIRGTPVMVQILIMFTVVLTSTDKLIVGIITFGLNSGAYVAEIIRGGIDSIDTGQFEAGRSLGFSYSQTMRIIIFPQAIKNVLPSLANEFIVLLKETSVVGYIALQDLTRAGDIIRGATFSSFMPLLAVALIYLTLVMFFTFLVSILEKRLKANER